MKWISIDRKEYLRILDQAGITPADYRINSCKSFESGVHRNSEGEAIAAFSAPKDANGKVETISKYNSETGCGGTEMIGCSYYRIEDVAE